MIPAYYHAPTSSQGSRRMRGPDDQTSHLFSYLSPEQRVRPSSMILSFRHPKGRRRTCQLDERQGIPLVLRPKVSGKARGGWHLPALGEPRGDCYSPRPAWRCRGRIPSPAEASLASTCCHGLHPRRPVQFARAKPRRGRLRYWLHPRRFRQPAACSGG